MRRTLLAILMLTSVVAPALAGEPDRQDLFIAGEGGYAIYRIPGLVVTVKGSLLAYCEARKTPGDWGHIDLLFRRSADGGKTWDAPRPVASRPADAKRNPAAIARKQGKEGEITLNNLVLIPDRAGPVHMLYCVEYGRCFYARSGDDGLTFGPPTEITATFDKFRPEYDWKVLATGPGHGIELSNGRLLVPVWLSLATESNGHRPSCVSTVYSDDGGKTWRHGEIVANNPKPKNPSETAAVELADGSVMLNIRHEGNERLRAVAVSPDGATKWSAPRFDPALPEPVCFASIVRYSKVAADGSGANCILFANPHNPASRERKNLTIKLSEDEGKTWPVARTLDPRISGYSDLAVGPDKTIYCLFERGGLNGKASQTAALTLATFDIGWVKGK
jgi:sialidase-1